MPLRDHFRPPVENEHSWDELHGMWPAVIVLTDDARSAAAHAADLAERRRGCVSGPGNQLRRDVSGVANRMTTVRFVGPLASLVARVLRLPDRD